jgi:hypothetical protein
LLPGERLLWNGRPKQGLLLRGEDIWLIPFSLIWSLVTLSGITPRLASGASQFNLVDLLFLAAGIYLLFGRFLIDGWLRSRTYYGVTDKQAIIVTRGFSQDIRFVNLRTLSDLKLSERRNGKGTIEFGKPRVGLFGGRAYRGMPWPGADQYLVPAFEMIADARQVHDLIVQTQRHAQYGP